MRGLKGKVFFSLGIWDYIESDELSPCTNVMQDRCFGCIGGLFGDLHTECRPVFRMYFIRHLEQTCYELALKLSMRIDAVVDTSPMRDE